MQRPSPTASLVAALSLAGLVSAGAASCSLGASVDEVLQPDDVEATTTGAPTGTGGAGGSGGGGTSSTGAAGGAMGPEACLDGVDNDGDGMTDCEDADCGAGYECVDAAPAGWQGPYRVDQGSPSDPASQCDGGTLPETFYAEPAEAAECTACTCSDLMGASCSAPSIACWPGSTSCNGIQQDWTPALQNEMCAKPTNLLGVTSSLSCLLSAPAAVVQKGTCTPSVVDFPNKDMWSGRVEACVLPSSGGGCGAGKACVPIGSDPAQSLCVKQDGKQACPAGFEVAVEAYADGDDTRACSACACGDATVTCSGSYTFYDANLCAMGGNNPPIAVDDSMCTNVSVLLDNSINNPSWSVSTDPATAQGSCPATGGQATGEVQPSGPVTFCCK